VLDLQRRQYSEKIAKLLPLPVIVAILVRALDLRLEIAGSIPAAALSSASLDKLFIHTVASVTKQYNLAPA